MKNLTIFSRRIGISIALQILLFIPIITYSQNDNSGNKDNIKPAIRNDTNVHSLITQRWLGSINVNFYLQSPDSYISDDYKKFLTLEKNFNGHSNLIPNNTYPLVIERSCINLDTWSLSGKKNDTLILKFMYSPGCNVGFDPVGKHNRRPKPYPIINKYLILKLAKEELILGAIQDNGLIDTIKFTTEKGQFNQVQIVQEALLEKLDAVGYSDMKDRIKIFYCNSKPYTGNTILFYNYGFTFKKHWTGQFVKGKKHDKRIEWSQKGKKIREENYLYGKKDGKWLSWDSHGRITTEENYKNGNKDGKFYKWYMNGEGSEYYYKEDKLHGLWVKWDADDGCRKEKRAEDGNYIDGKKEGKWIYWYSINQLSGYLHGLYTARKHEKAKKLSTVFHKYGIKKKVENYKNGEPHGLSTEWYINCYKKCQGNYNEGQQDGIWIYWNQTGRKVKEDTYRNGKLIDSIEY